MPRHNIDRLDRDAKRLQEALTDLAKQSDFEELLRLWRRPGWTTPAEFLLVQGSLEAMLGLAKQLGQMKATLINGSRKVGLETRTNVA